MDACGHAGTPQQSLGRVLVDLGQDDRIGRSGDGVKGGGSGSGDQVAQRNSLKWSLW